MTKMRRGRPPSREERALWQKVAETARPLSSKGFPLHTPTKAPTPVEPVEPRRPDTRIPSDFGIGRRTLAARSGQESASEAPAARRKQRKKHRPEAKIDLHGLTLAEAHPALIRFIQSARADGKRLVLVITGKGKDRDDDALPIPARRGILRQQVPGWLTSPPLADAVTDIATAHPRHGGSGAYYVYLRRLR